MIAVLGIWSGLVVVLRVGLHSIAIPRSLLTAVLITVVATLLLGVALWTGAVLVACCRCVLAFVR